jgi:hypothetical protein
VQLNDELRAIADNIVDKRPVTAQEQLQGYKRSTHYRLTEARQVQEDIRAYIGRDENKLVRFLLSRHNAQAAVIVGVTYRKFEPSTP